MDGPAVVERRWTGASPFSVMKHKVVLVRPGWETPPVDSSERRFELDPEPSVFERAALEEALARLLPPPPADPGRSAWWREGVSANLEPELERL
jgi:hypothetical protein